MLCYILVGLYPTENDGSKAFISDFANQYNNPYLETGFSGQIARDGITIAVSIPPQRRSVV